MMITATKHDADDDNNDAKKYDNIDGNGQNGAAFQCALQRAQMLTGCLAGYSDAHDCTVQALYSALAGCLATLMHMVALCTLYTVHCN